ncbi:MAG: hypothetical protein K8R11_03135 [Methanococcoides sp.]|nr:hypothetical protein [Methanococcoides sp.]
MIIASRTTQFLEMSCNNKPYLLLSWIRASRVTDKVYKKIADPSSSIQITLLEIGSKRLAELNTSRTEHRKKQFIIPKIKNKALQLEIQKNRSVVGPMRFATQITLLEREKR